VDPFERAVHQTRDCVHVEFGVRFSCQLIDQSKVETRHPLAIEPKAVVGISASKRDITRNTRIVI